jgi:hypothetical protein
MPVLGMNVGERPDDSTERDAVPDRRVAVEIRDIIVVDELVPERLAEDDPGKRRQKNADADTQPAAVRFRRIYRLSADRSTCGNVIVDEARDHSVPRTEVSVVLKKKHFANLNQNFLS